MFTGVKLTAILLQTSLPPFVRTGLICSDMAIQTPTVELPRKIAGKARTTGVSDGYDKNQSLRRDDRVSVNQSIENIRHGAPASALMRQLAETDGTISTAIVQFVSMAATQWRLEAYQTWTNEFSREGLMAAETVVSSLDTLWQYSNGYQDKRSLDELAETGLYETLLTGGVAAELILDKYKLPTKIVIVPYSSLDWVSDGKGGRYPTQKSKTGEVIDLNIANFWVAESIKSADRLYTIPVMISGVKRLIAYEGFVESMTRVIRQVGQPRLLIKLNYDKVRQAAPPETAGDAVKLGTYLEKVRSDMQSLLEGLNPEDALVYYDFVEVDSVATTGEKKDYKEMLEELSGLAASALKSNPSLLGLRTTSGSQNIASTEAMLSLKMARLFQKPIETVLSRALTLAVRLSGVDAYIKFKFKSIDLRPEAELEAHASMRQARVLELLSLGRITDDEAQVMLDLGSIPEGAEELTGTGFYGSKQPDTLPASGTNARNAAVMPGTPTSSGGTDNKQRA